MMYPNINIEYYVGIFKVEKLHTEVTHVVITQNIPWIDSSGLSHYYSFRYKIFNLEEVEYRNGFIYYDNRNIESFNIMYDKMYNTSEEFINRINLIIENFNSIYEKRLTI